jgi:hypothetical protein
VKIARRNAARMNQAIVGMLGTAPEGFTTDIQLVAFMVQGVMVGVSRRLLESDAPQRQVEALRKELALLVCTYLEASSQRSAADLTVVHSRGMRRSF